MLQRLTGVAIATLMLITIGIVAAPQARAASLPDFPMVLPVGWGEVVQGGGPHGHAGSVRSSVDLGASGNRSVDVVAVADGVIINVTRNCQVIIQHQDGWQTRYYHLKNMPSSLAVGQEIAAGTKVGMTGMPGSETCGRGTFRHVHLTLQKNGTEMPISGLSLGGYTVHSTGGAYCGYWTRNSDGAIVADARRACYAVPSVSNTLIHPSDLGRADGPSRDSERPVISEEDTISPSALLYVNEGVHSVGGRAWRTTCEPYSQTERCRTEIWATTVQKRSGQNVITEGWAFNNLTYIESPRDLWASNPLGFANEWTADDGSKWRTECDNESTGQNACRSYRNSTIVGVEGGKIVTKTEFTFNNIVRFS